MGKQKYDENSIIHQVVTEKAKDKRILPANWEKRRYEIAKSITASWYMSDSVRETAETIAAAAVEQADALIAKLRE